MGNFYDKISEAYAKGISDPRFQEAIEEIIKNPEKDEINNIKKIEATQKIDENTTYDER